LRRASVVDAGSIQRLESPYRRIGSGLQLGYQSEKTNISLNIFSARDKTEEVDDASIDSLDRPEQNLCLGLNMQQQISEKLFVHGEWAVSALTRDQNQPELENSSGFQRMFGLFRPRISTGYHQAYRFGIQFKPGAFDWSIQFERIDPGYRTLGSLYFQNDIENITTQIVLPILQGKFQLQTSLGLQRNDLNQVKDPSGFRRFIGNLALSAQWTNTINSQISWSNFRTTNRISAVNVPFVEVDSIVIVQSNNNLNLSNSFQIGQGGKQIITTNFGFQEAQTIRNDTLDGQESNQFLLGLVAYNLNMTHGSQRQSSLTASVLAHQNRLPIGNIFLFGPSLGYQMKWGKEKPLQLGATLALSSVRTEENSNSGLLRFQISGNYKIVEASQIGFTATYLDNQSAGQPFRELTMGIRFGYIFGLNKNGRSG
ncbi:MAG: hypothetical protein AAGF87_10280, partial [Bacteroidota bacterium]